MALEDFDLNRLKEKIRSAYKSDDPIIEKFRGYARRLKNSIRPIRTYSVNAVSFVSSDGGDNRLIFNPSIIELVRVVDSRGNECALDAVSSSTSIQEMQDRINPTSSNLVRPLHKLCSDLNKRITDLSYLLGGLGQPGKSTGAMRCYRDIVEWAVLYELIADASLQWGGDTILVRDGLLRTKSFKREVFPLIDQKIREGIQNHAKRNVHLSIVGVAKQSAVLSRLAIALELEAVFHKPFPCYVQVPEDIEQDCYNFDLTWFNTYESSEPDQQGKYLYQAMGKMFLAKFGDRPLDPVWPVDIAAWQVLQAEKILGQLTIDAQQGFPIPDYPMCIQRAHDHAKMAGLEIQVLQDLLFNGICEKLSPEETERLLRLKHLGQSLAALRYKEA